MIVLINLVFMILVFRFFKIQEHDRSSRLHSSLYGRSSTPFKIKFVIPIRKTSREDAEKTLKELISDYKQEIKIDDLFLPS